MKRTLGSILVLFLVAGSGAGQETRPTSQHGPDLELVRSFSQWSASHPEAAARLKARMDQNGDGKIDATEKELALQILRERREEFHKWAREHAEAEKKLHEKREQELKAEKARTNEPPKPVRAKDKVDAKERERQIQRAKERMERREREKSKAPAGK